MKTIGRTGITLVELLVVLAILTLLAGLTGLAFRASHRPGMLSVSDRIAEGRRAAITSGEAVLMIIADSAGTYGVRALSDGSVIAAPLLNIDGTSGRPLHVAR